MEGDRDAGAVVIERDDGVWLVVRPDNHNLDPADHAGYDGTRPTPPPPGPTAAAPRPELDVPRRRRARARRPATVNRAGGVRTQMTDEETAERKLTTERN
jgi:hypothetical protein